MAEVSVIPESIRLLKMDDSEYFSPKYKEYISNSKLGLINPDEGGSLELFLSPHKESYSDSLELGTALHANLLQPESYIISDIEKPNGKLGIWAEKVFDLRKEGYSLKDSFYIASEQADYYAKKLVNTRLKSAIRNSLPFYLKRMAFEQDVNKKTIFLSAPLREKYLNCLLNINNSSSKVLNTLYPPGMFSVAEFYNEYALLCDLQYVDTETGEISIVKFKSKFDNYTIDHELKEVVLNDVKSSSKPATYFMGNNVTSRNENDELITVWYNGSFQKYRYYRQIGVYMWLLQSALKHLSNINDYSYKANIIVVETAPEYKNKVFPIAGAYIREGLKEFKNLLKLVIDARRNGI